MPYMRTSTFERLIAQRTAALEERLREQERRLAGSELAKADLERRVARAEADASTAATQVEAQAMRIGAVHNEVAAAKGDLRTEMNRRFAMSDELFSALSLRAAEDRRQTEAALDELDGKLADRAARLERQLADLAARPAVAAGDPTTKAEVQALANELARLTIDLRGDLARAVDRMRPAGTPAPTSVIDLTDPSRADSPLG